MANNENGIKETILYYPTISIPSNKWLRQALLYWDEVGSIVPQRYEATEAYGYTDDLKYLIDEGQFRPFRTKPLTDGNWDVVNAFQEELAGIVKSDEFQRKLAPLESRKFNSPIHKEKVNEMMFDFFSNEGLAINHQNLGDWFYFENKTALLYMSVLAKYLADIDSTNNSAITISGTDFRQYNDLNFQPKDDSESFDALNFKFFNILPIPNENNTIKSIVEFKNKRKDELDRFRKTLKQFQKKASDCKSNAELNETLSDFQLEIRTGLNNLDETMRDSNLSIFAGSLESLIKASSPGWISTAIVGSGLANNIASVPIEYTIAGTIIGGAIGIGKYLVDKRNERRAARRNSPFTYLYSAKKLEVNK